MASQAVVPRLSLEGKVGQVIVAVWPGQAEHLAGLAALDRIGGVLLPAGAGVAREALPGTLNRLQRLATYPLLVAADPGALNCAFPGELALGAARQPSLARRCGALAGAGAREVGIHLVLAPALDVQRPGAQVGLALRSFGENPSLAAHLGAEFVAGCQAERALAVASGFPGRGNASYDPVRSLAVLAQDRETLERIDLLPYAEACRAGLGAIMSAHLHVTALDSLPNRLVTHSSTVVEGLLRRTLGFEGLLLCEDLDAPDVRARYAPGQAAVLAFAAGHDLLVTSSPEAVYRALYEVLLHGDVPLSRLDEAVGRIWAAKAWLGLPEERFVPAPSLPQAAGVSRRDMPAEALDLAREVARASLTVIRGRPEPVAGRRTLVLANSRLRPDGAPVQADVERMVAGRLARAAFQALGPCPRPAELEQALAAAHAADAALILLDLPPGAQGSRSATEAMVALAQALKRAGLGVAVVLLGDPHALARFAEADLLLYLPGDTLPYLEAAFAYLLGQIEAPGRLPLKV